MSAHRETQRRVATSLSTPAVTGVCEQEPGGTTTSFQRVQDSLSTSFPEFALTIFLHREETSGTLGHAGDGFEESIKVSDTFTFPTSLSSAHLKHGFDHLYQVHWWVPAVRGAGEVGYPLYSTLLSFKWSYSTQCRYAGASSYLFLPLSPILWMCLYVFIRVT